MSVFVGKSIGRYHILEQLGEGGMAIVYKAFDTRLEVNIAVKVIRIREFTPEAISRALKRFQREAKALARLNHPAIVKVTDFGDYENIPYLVMPFISGGNLKQYLNKHGRLPWPEAIRMLLPIAKALEYAHSQNVIHRDVKPSNILLTQDGQPMLTDFGVAKVLEEEATLDLTGTGATVGTPEYMAPEQVSSKNIDCRVDIYSLGIVLYEIVTGRKPYQADTPMAVMIMQARDPLPRPTKFVSNLPVKVEQILLKALAKKPEDRYQDMGAFKKALELVLETESQNSQRTNIQSIDGDQTRDILNPDKDEEELQSSKPNVRSGNSTFIKWLPIVGLFVCLCIGLSSGAGLLVWNNRNHMPMVNSSVLINSPERMAITTSYTMNSPNSTPEITASWTDTSSPEKQEKYISPVDNMEMVFVPEGEFRMGSLSGDQYAKPDEMPQHTVYLDGFWIDKTEITNEMFTQFIAVTGYRTDAEKIGTGTILDFNQAGNPWISDVQGVNWLHPHSASDSISDKSKWPVVQVSWNDADNYCRSWAKRRLPTEAEWEKAARGIDGHLYPWGNEPPNANFLNYDRMVGHLSDVGSYPKGASPYGALDMLGNAYEWVYDKYSSDYYQISPNSNPQGPTVGNTRVIRGGAWNYGLNWTRVASRSELVQNFRVETLGFRCAVSTIN